MSEAGGTLTVDILRAIWDAAANLPPKETWISSRLFPTDRALKVSVPNENFTLAHPSFWSAVERRVRVEFPSAPPTPLGQFGGMTAFDIDPHDGDAPDVALWRATERKRVMLILAEKLSPPAAAEPPLQTR